MKNAGKKGYSNYILVFLFLVGISLGGISITGLLLNQQNTIRAVPAAGQSFAAPEPENAPVAENNDEINVEEIKASYLEYPSTKSEDISASEPVITAKSVKSAAKSQPQGSEFVYASGSEFYAGGKPFYFAGANAYYLWYGDIDCSSPSANQGCVAPLLDDAASLGLNVIRTWGFCNNQNKYGYCFQPSPGVYDEATFAHFDEVIKEASDRGIRLIVSFVNNWDDFGGMSQYVSWCNASSHDEFYTNACAKQIYKDYVAYFLNRTNTITGVQYKDEPAIFAWELANEPRCTSDTTGETLNNWIGEMSAYIKSLDPNHMVATGTDGGYVDKGSDPFAWWYKGNEGQDYYANHNWSSIDFAEFHYYPEMDASLDANTWIQEHIDDAHNVIGKPVILGEFNTKTDRASNLDSWYSLMESEGINGDFFWMLSDNYFAGNEDGYFVLCPEHIQVCGIISSHADFMNNKTSPPDSSSCIVPENNMSIAESAVFCRGSYSLPEGINIAAGNLTLDCNGSTLSGQTGGYGITIDSLSNITVKNCNIKEYSRGFNLRYSSGNHFVNNSITSSTLNGHSAFYSYGSYGDEYINNTMEGAWYGIDFNRGDDCLISENKFLGLESAIDLIGSNITFWLNQFAGNDRDMTSGWEPNSFDNGTIGNYWSKYDSEEEGCYDNDSNFICDSPYTFGSYSDDFPLKYTDYGCWHAEYSQCQADDTMLKYYIHNSDCPSEPAPSDNNTFVACDYCTPDLQLRNTGCFWGEFTEYYFDANGCYAKTGLASDIDSRPENITRPCTNCLMPSDGMSIRSSAKMCYGRFYIPSGISIDSAGVVLDCNGAMIHGNKSSTGISVNGLGSTVKNCRVEKYQATMNLAQLAKVYNNTFANNKGGVMFSSGCNISGNRFINCSSALSGSHTSHNNIENNLIDGCTTAVSMHDSDYERFFNNTIIDCSRGFRIWWYSYNNEFIGNTIDRCWNGFYFDWHSDYNNFTGNRIYNSNNGFLHQTTWYGTNHDNVFEGNHLENNTYGFNMGSSFDCIFRGNTMVNNGWGMRFLNSLVNLGNYGYTLPESFTNFVYKNNFINNTFQAGNNGDNIWDNGVDGNYWNDFDEPSEGCIDSDNDGVCDSPFEVYDSNIDNYPIASKNGWSTRNHKPVLVQIENITVRESDFVEINPEASDEDGDSLEFFFSSPLDAEGKWQTYLGDAGTYNVDVTVKDGRGGNDTQTVGITVTSAGLPDLSIKSARVYTKNPGAGDWVTLQVIVENIGESSAFDTEWSLESGVPGQNLAFGPFVTKYEKTVDIYPAFKYNSSGNFSAVFTVDHGNNIAEANETNNNAVIPITIG